LLLQYPLSSLANILLSNPASKVIICAMMLPMDTTKINPLPRLLERLLSYGGDSSRSKELAVDLDETVRQYGMEGQ